ncbi:GbsR/MarR family transcriptional regulator [Longimicrobium sp.]|uniref:GbsR/MarR family transcriptional regulator n=1 Tax=Longimicrobium sp. TaxID=2029185 RepID=UPI002E346818|nr:MarR family transcriptional regulator [Longimicrobium sp.]HEX6036812.1 MarR family transcriptional regulator [Longimicrobium sp.]
MDQGTRDFIESMGRQFEEDGTPRIAGRLFGFLMLQEEPCSLDDVAEQLQVSKGSASSNARLLEQLGIAERVTRAGDRRDYYQISPDIGERTLERALHGLDRMLGRLRRGAGAVGERSATVRDRFAGTITFHERALAVVTDLLGQVRARRSA